MNEKDCKETHFRYIECVFKVYELIQVECCPQGLVFLTVSVHINIKSNTFVQPLITITDLKCFMNPADFRPTKKKRRKNYAKIE